MMYNDIYIYRERETCIYTHVYIYIYMYPDVALDAVGLVVDELRGHVEGRADLGLGEVAGGVEHLRISISIIISINIISSHISISISINITTIIISSS